tara:strand:- start:50 stop:364 length:315 start_codon:yes stop_codon:yes gene_type:complete
VSNNIQIKNGDSVNITSSTTASVNVKSTSNVTSVSVSRGGDKNYVHEQSSPSTTWTVNHNLNKRVAVSVVDSAGTLIICDVRYVSDSQVVLTFDAATSGNAYAN